MNSSSDDNLTEAQDELYQWIKNYLKDFQHSPSIRQMMDYVESPSNNFLSIVHQLGK